MASSPPPAAEAPDPAQEPPVVQISPAELEQALRSGEHSPLPFRTGGVFTVGGVALALMTIVLVIAQT